MYEYWSDGIGFVEQTVKTTCFLTILSVSYLFCDNWRPFTGDAIFYVFQISEVLNKIILSRMKNTLSYTSRASADDFRLNFILYFSKIFFIICFPVHFFERKFKNIIKMLTSILKFIGEATMARLALLVFSFSGSVISCIWLSSVFCPCHVRIFKTQNFLNYT